MGINFPNAPTVGQLWPQPAVTGVPVYRWDGQAWVTGSADTVGVGTVVRSYLTGLTLSTAGASASFAVAAGVAADSTNATMMAQTVAYTKNTGAWTLGSGAAGALDTGTISASAWYHVFLIKRPDTGVVDVLVSLSATTPTLPTNYTLFRRIGSMLTTASQWTGFIQIGDQFRWTPPIRNISVTNPGTVAVMRALTVPTGIVVEVDIVVLTANASSTAVYGLISSSAEPDTAPSGAGIFNFGTNHNTLGALQVATPIRGVWTDTAAQVRTRLSVSGASDGLIIDTFGWFDPRGRNT